VWLLDGLSEFLQKRHALARDRSGQQSDLELQAATAILLIEAAYGDAEYVWREHRTILKGLEREFGLGKREVLELLGRANEIRPPVVKLADVTDVICDRFTKQQREEVVRLVWRVIGADGSVDEWEGVFGDHVAKVLGLTSDEARAARARAT
jgi:uncharacterized tellurite resistance protein B-like protein